MSDQNFKVSKIKTTDGATIEYGVMGKGSPFLLVPGASDGMGDWSQTFGGAKVSLYGRFAHAHQVVGVCRREPLPPGAHPRDLARDYAWMIEKLGLGPVHVEGASGGGPVAIWLAVDRPDLVRSLVLAVTLAHTDESFTRVIRQWIDWIEAKNWSSYFEDVLIRSLTPQYKQYLPNMLSEMLLTVDQINVERQIKLYEGLCNFDFRNDLDCITCPTLIIGGDMDMITTIELQSELAKRIPGARQEIIQGQSHFCMIEASDQYVSHVLSFFNGVG